MSKTSETLSNVDPTQSLTPPSQLGETLPDEYLEIPSPSTTTISRTDDDFEEDKIDKIDRDNESESETEIDNDNSSPPSPNQPLGVNDAVFDKALMNNAKQIESEVGSMHTETHSLTKDIPNLKIAKVATGMTSGGKTRSGGGQYPRASLAKTREGDYVQGWTFDFSPLLILQRVNDTKHTSRQTNDPKNIRKKKNQGSGAACKAACSERELEIHGGVSETSLATPESCENSAKSRIQVLFQRYLETHKTRDVTVAQGHSSHGRLKSIMQVKSEQDAAIQALKHGPRRFQARPVPRHSNLSCRRPVAGKPEVFFQDDGTK